MGAAACAVCYAVPLLSLQGVAGAVAPVAIFVFAGVVVALVVAGGALYAVWSQRCQRQREACVTDVSPGDVAFSAGLPGWDAGTRLGGSRRVPAELGQHDRAR